MLAELPSTTFTQASWTKKLGRNTLLPPPLCELRLVGLHMTNMWRESLLKAVATIQVCASGKGCPYALDDMAQWKGKQEWPQEQPKSGMLIYPECCSLCSSLEGCSRQLCQVCLFTLQLLTACCPGHKCRTYHLNKSAYTIPHILDIKYMIPKQVKLCRLQQTWNCNSVLGSWFM